MKVANTVLLFSKINNTQKRDGHQSGSLNVRSSWIDLIVVICDKKVPNGNEGRGL